MTNSGKIIHWKSKPVRPIFKPCNANIVQNIRFIKKSLDGNFFVMWLIAKKISKAHEWKSCKKVANKAIDTINISQSNYYNGLNKLLYHFLLLHNNFTVQPGPENSQILEILPSVESKNITEPWFFLKWTFKNWKQFFLNFINNFLTKTTKINKLNIFSNIKPMYFKIYPLNCCEKWLVKVTSCIF